MASSTLQSKHSDKNLPTHVALSPSLVSFEQFKQQLALLNEDELRRLRNEINRKLDDDNSPCLTEEESRMIASLFS